MGHGKRRHLAALTQTAASALVGWYLMMPPDSAKIPHEVESSAPLSRWAIVATFDTSEKCEAALADLQNRNRDPSELDTTGKLRRFQKRQPPDPALGTARAIGSGCVESNDFRLKGNKAATQRDD